MRKYNFSISNETGFKIIKKGLKKSSVDNFFSSFLNICKFYGPNYFKSNRDLKNWNSERLSEILIRIRKKNPKIFSRIYDVVQKTSAIQRIIIDNNLDTLASKFLNVPTNKICSINHALRMDPPFDKKNTLNWHQDGSFNRLSSNDSCVVWCPLVDVNNNNGAIKVLLKSYKNNIPAKPKFSKRKINEYKEKSIEMDSRDILIMNNLFIHKSGFNKSNKIRFTLRCRFNKLPLSNSFVFKNK